MQRVASLSYITTEGYDKLGLEVDTMGVHTISGSQNLAAGPTMGVPWLTDERGWLSETCTNRVFTFRTYLKHGLNTFLVYIFLDLELES